MLANGAVGTEALVAAVTEQTQRQMLDLLERGEATATDEP